VITGRWTTFIAGLGPQVFFAHDLATVLAAQGSPKLSRWWWILR